MILSRSIVLLITCVVLYAAVSAAVKITGEIEVRAYLRATRSSDEVKAMQNGCVCCTMCCTIKSDLVDQIKAMCMIVEARCPQHLRDR